MRTETKSFKHDSELKMPIKSKKAFSKDELEALTIKLAEVHGLI